MRVLGEADVVDCFVVGDQLSGDLLLLNVPDGAGSVDGRGADDLLVHLVPVEGSQRSAELVVLRLGLIVQKQVMKMRLRFYKFACTYIDQFAFLENCPSVSIDLIQAQVLC